MNRRIVFTVILIVGLIFLADADVMAQCAMCKKNIESNLESGGSIGKALNSGILYLMAVPYLLLMGVVGIFFRKQLAEKWASFRRKAAH